MADREGYNPFQFESKMQWPPKGWEEVFKLYGEHAAWYSGNIEHIDSRFWRTIRNHPGAAQIHVPIASDLATFNADILFSEFPTVDMGEGNKKSMERFEEIVQGADIVTKLAEAAETQSSMGGLYLKPVWDQELADHPLLSIAQPDNAIPEFKHGMLQAVTFFKTLEVDHNRVIRLLERHEKGVFYNALFVGTSDQIGERRPLTYHPYTMNMQDYVETGLDTVGVRYVPNLRPHKRFRGSALGMSDFTNAESLMDALDSTMSSWQRDIELGKGRILTPEGFLKRDKEGNASFDMEQEVYTELEMDPASYEGSPLTVAQFEIRVEEHRKTALEYIDRIVTNAGYSPQSFGLKIEGRAESGTALNIRERKTYLTKKKKARFFENALSDVFHMMLQIDREQLGNPTKVPDQKPNVTIDKALQHDIDALANTVNTLKQAESASVETRVRLVNPGKDEQWIQDEVKRIKDESGTTAPDPLSIGNKEY